MLIVYFQYFAMIFSSKHPFMGEFPSQPRLMMTGPGAAGHQDVLSSEESEFSFFVVLGRVPGVGFWET